MSRISNDEAKVYDRQIRLWGIDAQNRLRNSTVLIVGLSGLGAEITKNLMLSGLKSLVLMDDKKVSTQDNANFFISHDTNLKNRAEASLERVRVLNPLVEVKALAESPANKSEGFFTDFDLVILVDQDFNSTNSINKICRKLKIRFQAAGVFGWVGYAFFDFSNHPFFITKPKESETAIESILDDDDVDGTSGSELPEAKKIKNGNGRSISEPVTVTIADDDEKIKKTINFPSFEQTFDAELGAKRFLRRRFNFPGTYFIVRAFLRLSKNKGYSLEEAVSQWRQELGSVRFEESKQKIQADDFPILMSSALNPVCAIVGSVAGQEVIKALSQNEEPLRNVFLYSAHETVGVVCDMNV